MIFIWTETPGVLFQLFIMPYFRVPSPHPWTVSTPIKTKWSLNILLPIVYFGLWKRINLRFSRVFMFWMARMENKIKEKFIMYFMCVFRVALSVRK